ncbi:MAG: SusC/RagA family TonB-linked outer membrane protein [Rikenellaceae bacterium]|jgi:TonB-linked SusC/RagA family outer membrane protein|nr:SusC/RagA family TonB-linked outer membrane protein [Rikenellaceae bacterium]
MKKTLLNAFLLVAVSIGVVQSASAQNAAVNQQTSAPRTVEGRVTNQAGDPLAGVIVSVKGGAGRSTTSSENGSFVLVVDDGARTLTFSMLGMETKEVAIGAARNFSVTLAEQAATIDDVVVTALGIKRSEKALAYNVQKVGADELNAVKSENFVTQLAGKVSGLEIKQVSGGVGTATRVTLRGARSIAKSNSVLYVIDGMPINNFAGSSLTDQFESEVGSEGIADVNPEDIESISALTGAAATALYGENAANGAILITTKKGAAGNARISYSNQTTFATPYIMPEFQNTYGNDMGAFESWGGKLRKKSSYNPRDFFNTGSTVQHSLSLSGGTERNYTYASVGATSAAGIIQNNNYERYNFNVRNTGKYFNDKLTLDVSFNYMQQWDRNLVAQGEYFNPLVPVYLFPRGEEFDYIRNFERFDDVSNIYVQNWDYGDKGMAMQNPYWIINRNLFEHKRKRYVINPSVSYQVLDWLTASVRLRLDNANARNTRKLYATTTGLLAGTNSKGNLTGNYRQTDLTENQLYLDGILQVDKTFGDYRLNAVAGASLQDWKSITDGLGGTLEHVANLFQQTNLFQPGTFGGAPSGKQIQSVFGSAEIGWKNAAYLTLTGRNDWSSTLAVANVKRKDYFYPSVGASGVISELVNLPKAISYLKVRGSLAWVGLGIPPQFWSAWTYNPANSQAFEPTKTRPPGELKPEQTRSWEGGVDIRLFDNSLRMEATYYHTNTFNQTINIPISAGSGYNNMWIQTGNVMNRGVELAANYRKQWGKFGWEPSLTASWNENKVLDLGSGTDPQTGEVITKKIIERNTVGSMMIRLTEGGTLGDFWSTTTLARDVNGNVNVDDKGQIFSTSELVKMGTSMPKWRFGFRNEFSWNGVNLGILFTARTGGLVLSRTQAMLDAYGVSKASAELRDAGGKQIGNGQISARTWYEIIGGKQGIYKYYLYSADNFRLQELRIGYSLPSKWFADKVKMNVAAVGSNLWMIYNKAPFDPELTASTSDSYQGVDYFMQPSTRTFGFSVKLDF